jgi:hypothetical protein
MKTFLYTALVEFTSVAVNIMYAIPLAICNMIVWNYGVCRHFSKYVDECSYPQSYIVTLTYLLLIASFARACSKTIYIDSYNNIRPDDTDDVD